MLEETGGVVYMASVSLKVADPFELVQVSATFVRSYRWVYD